MFLIKETIKSLFRAKFASIISIITIIIASFLVTAALWLTVSSGKINKIIADKIEVRVFIKDSASKTSRAAFENNVKKKRIVKSIIFVSKADAAKKVSQSLGIAIEEIINHNPLPNAYVIKFKNLDSDKVITNFIRELKAVEIVDDVTYEKLLLAKLNSYFPVFRLVIFAIALVFTLVAIYLVLIVNRMIMEKNRKNYDIMKLVGAKLSTIRIPLYLNGFLLSLFAVIISTPILFFIFKFVNRFLALGEFEFDLKITIIAFVIFAFILGIVGSIYSSRKISLKFKY